MALDVATLRIVVDASQVQPATTALRGLEAQGTRVQTATGGATVGMGRLNNAILGLARQATGAHPVVARFADVLFSMALGGAKMTAVLGGLAAVALLYRELTKDARFAREEAERLHGALRDLATPAGADRQRVLAFGTDALRQARADLADVRARDVAADFRLRGGPSGQAALDAARQRHAEDVNTALNRVLVLNAQLLRATSPPFAFEGPLANEGARIQAMMDLAERSIESFMRLEMPRLTAGIAAQIEAANRTAAVRQSPGLPTVADVTDLARFTQLTPMLSVEAGRGMYQRAVQRELELDARRIAANQALVTSLANVGRAYGGVTDQVLNLAAATFSIHQAGSLPGFLPGASRGDRAIAFGSAALTGVGFGASTGNPVLGGLGGGLGALAMGAGPAGIIVGAVGGIVSGLFEQGRRARQAARMWQAAFEDFALMFDDLTPLEQRLHQNQQAFRRLSGGFTPEQVRGIVGAADAGQFTGFTAQGIEALRRLLAEYEKNVTQANEMADAEKRLHDARRDVLSALNAPSGLNLAAYGYAASSSGAMVVQGDLVLHVRNNVTEALADVRRLMRQGGPSPYLDVAR